MYPIYSSVFALLICAIQVLADPESLLVQTSQGPVQGYKYPRENIFAFYGIPYATAPTGPNRYKAALPAPNWTTPFEAVDDTIVCPQNVVPGLEFFFQGKNFTENCLITNIYKPNTNETNLPVLVYIHGGAFQIGYGNWYYPKKFTADQNFVVVTFNYRLGIHGFLCLGTDEIPGNAGLKDQVALLRWVKKNIASFGGNPDDVTVSGYSAGATSVELLSLSPAANGLFTKLILDSAGIFAASGAQGDPIENAKEFARRYITNVDDIAVLEEFYISASFDVITSDSFIDRKNSTFLFTPCVERATAEESFLTDSPYNIVLNGKYNKVPILYGFSNMEGLFRLEFFELWKDAMNENFVDFVPGDLKFNSPEEKNKVALVIKQFYFGHKNVSNDNILSYINFFSDVIFIYPIIKAVKLYTQTGHDQIYLYEYSFVDDDHPTVPYTDVRGADHCAQTYAIIDGAPFLNKAENEISEEYKAMKAIMRQIWANFIRTGVPIPAGSELPAWPVAVANGLQHMSLNSTLELRGYPHEDRMRLWEGIYDQYYNVPQPPQTHLHSLN